LFSSLLSRIDLHWQRGREERQEREDEEREVCYGFFFFSSLSLSLSFSFFFAFSLLFSMFDFSLDLRFFALSSFSLSLSLQKFNKLRDRIKEEVVITHRIGFGLFMSIFSVKFAFLLVARKHVQKQRQKNDGINNSDNRGNSMTLRVYDNSDSSSKMVATMKNNGDLFNTFDHIFVWGKFYSFLFDLFLFSDLCSYQSYGKSRDDKDDESDDDGYCFLYSGVGLQNYKEVERERHYCCLSFSVPCALPYFLSEKREIDENCGEEKEEERFISL